MGTHLTFCRPFTLHDPDGGSFSLELSLAAILSPRARNLRRTNLATAAAIAERVGSRAIAYRGDNSDVDLPDAGRLRRHPSARLLSDRRCLVARRMVYRRWKAFQLGAPRRPGLGVVVGLHFFFPPLLGGEGEFHPPVAEFRAAPTRPCVF